MGLPERVATVAVLPDSGSPTNRRERSEGFGQDTGRKMAQVELPRFRRVRQDVREGKPVFSRVKTNLFTRELKD